MTLSTRPFTSPVLHLLRQGLTPEKLALAVALGIGVSCFPVFGTTTILCALAALAFGLNLPAIQIGNYLALPLQLLLFFPFLRLGERVLLAQRMPLSPEQLLAMAKTSPDKTARILLAGQWHAIVGWVIVAPAITVLSVLVLRPIMRLLLLRAGRTPMPAAIRIQR